MSKYLVVVESPAKAKTINKMLGRNYLVKACFGAVRDLPKSTLGVDVEDNFKPKYITLRQENTRKALKAIKEAAAKSEKVLLASDPDREGEAICWHLKEELAKSTKAEFHRVMFNEITKRAVREAFERPQPIDINKVDAQQAITGK